MRSYDVCRKAGLVLKVTSLLLLVTAMGSADTLWTKTYSGPYGGDDAARVVLTDTFDNVVVVGSSAGAPGSGGFDMVAIKYSWFHGNTLWTTRITGASVSDDIAKDAALDSNHGRVVVVGQMGEYPDYNFLIVQLDPNGSELWRAVYDGTAHGADVATAVAVDSSGSVFVTGYAQNATIDFVTMKYYWDGSRAWIKTFDSGGDNVPSDITLGPDGSVFVTGNSGGTSADYVTVKYSAAGEQQWVATYNGPNNAPDEALAMAADDSGNVYVTGSSRTAASPGALSYIATVKYDSAGTEQWVSRYEKPGSWPAALALGPTAIYVAGRTSSAQGDDDYITIAYDYQTGDTLWARRDTGPTGSGDAAVGVAVGSDGSVWVAGSSNYDFMTVLYAPDGVEHWVETYGSPGDDQMAAISVDKANRVAVTGLTWAGTGYDILTVKFDTIGPGVAEPPVRRTVSGLCLSVRPNPSASGRAELRFLPLKARTAHVTVSSVDGRVILTRSVETNGSDGNCQLDLRRFGAGVYVVRLESGGRLALQKLVVGQ